jgi:glycosyltransferase involved in cell wall biosynthesis
VFADWTSDVSKEFAGAGMLLASAPAEPFGLTVVEAMAAGVPVVAAASGGHLETVGLLGGPGLFPPSDPEALAAALRTFASDLLREDASRAGRVLAMTAFSIEKSVRQLLDVYLGVLSRTNRDPNT